uniref:Transferase-like protein n=1 Tax=Thermochaetoides thermophila TaxID=209285 RepID=UPI0021B84E24|nr:Chain A, Transferase-like protein [Thermochaetoides thermophila]7Z3H_B Chain B, Transferase-like protein [Thermochaetoides thermophila]7Z3H_C Chain C, Transferase-like protein [Thermochaetoides thermophila]7Z3H_D Chain D, Transferase-like protein [Thermochaetoides thermophila]7Z3H_E Chain E, Transferase-like protein [Thermochaetoides thermophila]7Z3H_F Chain F, Transferase-like protein [Thermochaetoides thermophila]
MGSSHHHHHHSQDPNSRHYTSLTFGPINPSIPSSYAPSGISHLLSRQLVVVYGPDAAKYLQGMVTANVYMPGSGSMVRTDRGYYAALLTGQGRVLYDVFIYPLTDSKHLQRVLPSADVEGAAFLIEVDKDQAGLLVDHIKRYRVRAKVKVKVVDVEEVAVWHAWDPNGLGEASVNDLLVTPDCRTPAMGSRILHFGGPDGNAIQNFAERCQLQVLPQEYYVLHRITQGVPEGQTELLKMSAIPHESNLDLMGGIDFRKGCYVGQELVTRTEHRGVVRKRVLPCVVYEGSQGQAVDIRATGGDLGGLYTDRPIAGLSSAREIASETNIVRVSGKGRGVGKWLRGIGNVGLAVCRLDVMTDLPIPGETPAGEDGVPEVREVKGEFTIEGDEGPLRIKAVPPAWLRRELMEKWEVKNEQNMVRFQREAIESEEEM